jgi:energy-converting hydrogenase Eha subunit A
MNLRSDNGISDIIGTILIISLIAVLTMVVAALFMGLPLLPQKPVLAAFSVETVMGADTTSSHLLTVPVISLHQLAGDNLTQEYTAGVHTGINGTKIKLIDPNGKMYPVTQSVTMTSKVILKGQYYYIFHRQIGEPVEYWITMDPARIYDASWGGVDLFSPRGKWRVIITDEKNTNTVLFQKDVTL